MSADINIFRDPPTQAELNARFAVDRRSLTTGERIALGPGVLGLEVLVGLAVDGFSGELMREQRSPWEPAPGALDWDWSKSIFAESYAKKVRAMGRELVRGEVSALTRQLSFEQDALSAARDAGELVTNVTGALVSRFFSS